MDIFTKRRVTLTEILGLEAPVPNGAAWHTLLLSGLPYHCLKSVAAALGLPEASLASEIGLSGHKLGARKRTKALSLEESDYLYAIARVTAHMLAFTAPAEVAKWLTQATATLLGMRPLDLLRTRLGTEYVTAAVNRLRPAPVTRHSAPASSTEED